MQSWRDWRKRVLGNDLARLTVRPMDVHEWGECQATLHGWNDLNYTGAKLLR